MFQTERRENSLYFSYLNELSDDLTNARTSLKLAVYREVVATKTFPKSYWSILKSRMEKSFRLYYIFW